MYAQALLREYVAEANDVARAPRWYNTLTGNCTTLVFGMIRAIRPGLHLDYRILLSGYLPDYAYDMGATDLSAAAPARTVLGSLNSDPQADRPVESPFFHAVSTTAQGHWRRKRSQADNRTTGCGSPDAGRDG